MAAYGLTIAPNNAAIVYSPYTWSITSGGSTTINAGAYFRMLFTGNSCGLTFNVANLGSPASEIWTRIDGYTAWAEQAVVGTNYCTMPSDTTASPWHLLEVVVKSTSETLNRWNAPSNTAVILTGILLDTGASVSLPAAAPLHLFCLGDSITEGVRTINSTATNDTDRNDAKSGWAFDMAAQLGAEVGIVGFGATGLTQGGSGGVPSALTYWNTLLPGIARPLTPAPDAIIINHGTNDQSASGTTVTNDLTSLLGGMLTATPSATKIFVLRPFGGYQSAALQAGVAAVKSPRVKYVDTTGVLNNAFGIDGLGLHPLGPNDLGLIGPKVAGLLRPLLVPPASSAIRFRNMF